MIRVVRDFCESFSSNWKFLFTNEILKKLHRKPQDEHKYALPAAAAKTVFFGEKMSTNWRKDSNCLVVKV